MKAIEKREIEKVLEIVKPAPLIRIGHFADSGEDIPEVLSKFCDAYDYEYVLNCTDNAFFAQMKEHYSYLKTNNIRSFNMSRASYMQQGKFYDYLFVSSFIDPDDRETFLQKAHKVIKNAGLILIFIESKQKKDIYQWNSLLEENYFVATNAVELDSSWSVIISKKMHGWGG